MKLLATIITAAALAAGFSPSAHAQARLKVGDKAPAIDVDTWVKGSAVTSFEDGKVYVMEFWATWCGPCIKGIPHLTELQHKYADQGVTIVGTSIWETGDTQAAKVDRVKQFVEGQGDKMDYTVAVDNGSVMSDTWMKPAGRRGIPSAFIVGKTGLIEWIGHPSSMDAALAKAVGGGAAPADKPAEPKKPKVLKVGDKAPAITIGNWIKGAPMKAFEPGKVYVMEFWATWCGPCIAGIPHLTELQHEYKDKGVTIVGTAIWQREDTQAARLETVSSFVKQQGKKMDYTIALDDGTAMSDAWMRPAGRNGIPSAFIVGRKGTIEWMGHPARMDDALEQIVDGTFDSAAFAAQEAKDRAWTTDSRNTTGALRRAEREGDSAKAMELVDELAKKHPDQPMALQMKYRTMLKYGPNRGAVSAYGARIAKANWDDAMFLNAISWWTVDDADAAHRNVDQAYDWAVRADELTDHKDAQIMDTLARCLWEQGKRDKAIALQRKAVEHASEQMKDSIQSTLDQYLTEAAQG